MFLALLTLSATLWSSGPCDCVETDGPAGADADREFELEFSESSVSNISDARLSRPAASDILSFIAFESQILPVSYIYRNVSNGGRASTTENVLDPSPSS